MISWIRAHKQTIIKVLGSILALIALFFLFKQQSWDEVLDAARRVTWFRFLTATILLVLSRFFTVARWHILLRSGGVDISIKQTTSITFTGLFASNFLPTTIGGDIIRVGGTIQLGYNRAICAASIVVDRLVGMFGMALFLPFGIPSFIRYYSETSLLSTNIFFLKKSQKNIQHIIRRITDSLALWKKQPFALLLATLFSVCHMFSIFFALQTMISGLGESISIWTLAGLWSLTYFITLLPISVNGYGVQELSLTYFLANIGGLALDNSLAIAVLIRVIIMLASVPGVIFLPSILSNMKKENTL